MTDTPPLAGAPRYASGVFDRGQSEQLRATLGRRRKTYLDPPGNIDDLKRDKREPWDGIRNYQARNMMRDDMRVGDEIFFYHSNCKEPGIVGLAKVASKPYPDHTQFDPESKYFDPKSSEDNPRWCLVDVKFVRKLKRTITLTELKAMPELDGFALTRKGNRLSIMPVDPEHWDLILGME